MTFSILEKSIRPLFEFFAKVMKFKAHTNGVQLQYIQAKPLPA